MSSYNCPNCNAPRTGNVCEYCGTLFGMDPAPEPDNIVIPIYIGNEKIDEVIRSSTAWDQFRNTAYDFGINMEKAGDDK